MRQYILIIIWLFGISAGQESKIIDVASFEGKSLEDLYIMRNEIFARHGYPFKNYELYLYFLGQGWYKADTGYSDAKLTKTEWANINTIKQKEQELMKNNYLTQEGRTFINFENVINEFQFNKFSEDEVGKLTKNGFLVTPADYEQFFLSL